MSIRKVTIDVQKMGEEDKRIAQHCFFALGIDWADPDYSGLCMFINGPAKYYTNVTISGEATRFLIDATYEAEPTVSLQELQELALNGMNGLFVY